MGWRRLGINQAALEEGYLSLGGLTLSAERRNLPLALEPAVAHTPTDLAEWFLAPLSGLLRCI